MNFYTYVHNNPLNAVDPDGLFVKKIVKKIVKKQIKNIPLKGLRKALDKIFDIPWTPTDIITDPDDLDVPPGEGDSDGDGIPDMNDSDNKKQDPKPDPMPTPDDQNPEDEPKKE